MLVGGSFGLLGGAPAPVNVSAPVISGTNQPGYTLTTTNGTWLNSPTSFTYQWKVDGSPIIGATASTYLVLAADVGHQITCEVTAINVGGSASATSNALNIISDYTLALLHLDGANGSTTITDATGKQAWQIYYPAALSTTEKRFGTASLRLDVRYAAVRTVGSFTFPSTFTLECFLRYDSPVPWHYFINSASYGFVVLYDTTYSRFQISTNNGAQIMYLPATIPAETWQHFAIVKSGGVAKVYLHGTPLSVSGSSGGVITPPSAQLYLGYTNGFMNAYIDEFRISKNARYTSSFTPPTSAFSVD